MSVHVQPGARLRSAVSTAEVVVVRAPGTVVDLRCGGAPMVPLQEPAGPVAAPDCDDATLLGKRYVDEPTALELLCTRGGAGGLTVDGRALGLRGATALPSSD